MGRFPGATLPARPVQGDVTNTRALVKKINARLKQIEAGSDRVDTQTFALLAAFSFAAEL